MANNNTPPSTNKFKNILLLLLSAAGIFYAVQNWETLTNPEIITNNEQQTEQIQDKNPTEIPSNDRMTTVDLTIGEEREAEEIAEIAEEEAKQEIDIPTPRSPEKKTSNKEQNKPKPKSDTDKNNPGNQRLMYDNKDLILTRHAKCRMGCREISKAEVAEVIREGKINKRKSNPNDPRGCPIVALEDVTEDGQLVRIIVANCDKVAKLVTVIDLKNNYKCTCK